LSGFVVCAACGARIKANRTHCLRCHAPLPAPSPAGETPARSTSRPPVAAIAGAAVGLLVVGLLWLIWPATEGQTPSISPAANATTAATRDAPGAARTAEAPPAAAGTFLDSRRAAGAAFTSGDFQKARAEFEQALQKNSDDPEALNGLGLTLERAGDIQGAVARFERATALAGDKWAYHFNLAHALGRLPDWERAIAEYRQAAQLFPTDYATQFNLALALQKKGDDREAIPEFEKAIALAPGEPSFHLNLGNSLAKAGRLTDAQQAFRRYLELEPEAPDAAKVKAHIDTLGAAAARPISPPPAATAKPALP
jgi:tetratricopeptide (TPR) repeat protein